MAGLLLLLLLNGFLFFGELLLLEVLTLANLFFVAFRM